MTEPNRTPSPDEAREIDYVLQKIRFSFMAGTIFSWLAALLLYFVAHKGAVFAIAVGALVPLSQALVWTFGFRGVRGSLSPFVDRRTGKLHIPGGRKRLRISDGLRLIFWGKRETKLVTVGVGGSGALLVIYLLLGSPRL
jgi:hypothetical protein